MHRLRRGLPGYLILFAPHAFVPQRQLQTSRPPSPLMFFVISMHFTATPRIPSASSALKKPSIKGHFTVKRQDFTPDLAPAYVPFTPNDSGQRLHPTYYRGCWHGVSRCLFTRYRHRRSKPSRSSLVKSRLQPIGPSSGTRRGCVRLSPIAQDSSLLPPVGVWAVSQSQCGGSSSQTPSYHRLGRPLPYQLTNSTQTHL